MFSILHISDLHRSSRDNITNAELISALVSDLSRYTNEDPPIRPPDAIVVSGDIIQGVPLGTDNGDERIAEQYTTALEFLVELTERFLGGDRSRVVVVPGNHDIDWQMAHSAMTTVPEDQVPKNLANELYRTDTPYRWDWKTRTLFEIVRRDVYESRLDAFWRFFETFYSGVPGLLRVERGASANLFSLCGGRIGLAAFNSCHGNDCFAFHGSIPREAVAQAHLDLSDTKAFELLVAVWHHNVEGPPYRTDYMDIDIVRGMIGRGFRLGLFGHQHRVEATPVQIHLANSETMAIVSAGSLCAGAQELPTGALRGYNIIEIDDTLREARVHAREMSTANLFTPSRRSAFGGASSTTLRWVPPPDRFGRAQDVRKAALESLLQRAEAELKSGGALAAKELLRPHAASLPDFGRRLLQEAARQSSDSLLLQELLAPPRSIGDLVELCELCIQARAFAAARQHLNVFSTALGVAAPHINELRARITAAEAMTI